MKYLLDTCVISELAARQPEPGVIDSLLAATAPQGGLALVTRNEADFAHCGAAVVNPWERCRNGLSQSGSQPL